MAYSFRSGRSYCGPLDKPRICGVLFYRDMLQMKWILPLTLIVLSGSGFAYDITHYSGQCFTVDEKNAQSCAIQRGVGSGGGFIYLEFAQKEYLIEQSTTCGGNCKPYLGTTPEDVLSAKKYKKGQWNCFKQEQGSMNVCYTVSK